MPPLAVEVGGRVGDEAIKPSAILGAAHRQVGKNGGGNFWGWAQFVPGRPGVLLGLLVWVGFPEVIESRPVGDRPDDAGLALWRWRGRIMVIVVGMSDRYWFLVLDG